MISACKTVSYCPDFEVESTTPVDFPSSSYQVGDRQFEPLNLSMTALSSFPASMVTRAAHLQAFFSQSTDSVQAFCLFGRFSCNSRRERTSRRSPTSYGDWEASDSCGIPQRGSTLIPSGIIVLWEIFTDAQEKLACFWWKSPTPVCHWSGSVKWTCTIGNGK